jgi:hypothetical protein
MKLQFSINFISFARPNILLGRWLSSGLLRRVVWWKFTNVSEVLAACIIALMMEAARISETLVNFYQTTRCYNPEDSNLQTNSCQLVKRALLLWNLKLLYCVHKSVTGSYPETDDSIHTPREKKCRGCVVKNEFLESEEVSDVKKIHIHACMHACMNILNICWTSH